MTTEMKIESSVVMSGDMKIGKIYLYDDICPDNVSFLTGGKIKSETSGGSIKDRLAECEGCKELEIHVSSRGGDVRTGFNLYSQIQAFKADKKTAYIDGIAASIATVIAMAADEVVMGDVGLMMIHNASAGVYGTANDLRKAAEDLDVITGAAKSAYLAHSGGKISEEELTDMMDKETWLTAEQCLKYGLCDRIETSAKGAGISSEGMAALYNAMANLWTTPNVGVHKQAGDVQPAKPECPADGAAEQSKPNVPAQAVGNGKMAGIVAAALIGLGNVKNGK